MPSAAQTYASPTESNFSDADGPESAKNWDEDKVCEYLRSVKCGEYEKLFRKNHINGENLLEMDKEVLKEMGIEKVGDRVRLFLGIKKLRTKAYANQKKRNRVSSPMIHRSVGLRLRPRPLTKRLSGLLWWARYSVCASSWRLSETLDRTHGTLFRREQTLFEAVRHVRFGYCQDWVPTDFASTD